MCSTFKLGKSTGVTKLDGVVLLVTDPLCVSLTPLQNITMLLYKHGCSYICEVEDAKIQYSNLKTVI